MPQEPTDVRPTLKPEAKQSSRSVNAKIICRPNIVGHKRQKAQGYVELSYARAQLVDILREQLVSIRNSVVQVAHFVVRKRSKHKHTTVVAGMCTSLGQSMLDT